MTSYRIPFNRPGLAGNELRYIQESVDSGRISGDGVFTERCRHLLEELIGAPRVLLTTSCTTALEMAALLLDLASGDEVIMPSFTFVSTANAVVLRGARPVFVDIRPDTLNLDERLLERLITPRTRAIVPVHYAGISCEMDALLTVANRHRLEVVEDNAQGLFGEYRGRPLGSVGGLAALSFHETKNISCGEGGALVINDARYIERAEIIREKGTNRSRVFRGLVDKYTWVDVGSSALPSDLLAAFLYAQLERRADIQAKRRRIWECYARELAEWAAARGIGLPLVPDHCRQPYHLFYLINTSLDQRTRLIAHLKARGILAVFHYLPLHLSEMGQRFGGKPGDCPVTEDLSDRVLRLPFYNDLSEEEQAYVIDSLRRFDG
ncbi:MAG TPA: dTDP-4-amino-4,6-dideoxygalactose transaminase [Methylomirabilota bacterium]|jgi:dTDP-4-amino-4,6-dideoxygalactose transaminase|nr:dTDP-4-amino-4,6-dideoxygalactose transaminase [Methylomirabilota bacterium]